MGIPVYPSGGEKVLNSPHRVLMVGPDYFNAMQIRLLLGRGIEEHDHAGSNPVAVIDELYAKSFFGSGNPIGRHLTVSDGDKVKRDVEIVGVSRSVRYGNLKRDMPPTVFLPFDQGFPQPTQMTFTLRTTGDPLLYANTVREIVRLRRPASPRLRPQDSNAGHRRNHQSGNHVRRALYRLRDPRTDHRMRRSLRSHGVQRHPPHQ